MGWDMREGLLGWDAEGGIARAWAFGCGGCSVLFGPRSASGGAAQHRWRFGHDLAISVMT